MSVLLHQPLLFFVWNSRHARALLLLRDDAFVCKRQTRQFQTLLLFTAVLNFAYLAE